MTCTEGREPSGLAVDDLSRVLGDVLRSPTSSTQAEFAMVFRACTLIVFVFSAALASGDSPSSLSFPEPESTYIITFAGSMNAFTETQTSVNLGSVIKDKAPPVQTTIVHKISHFVVKELGPANWVLLEHASDLHDASKWNGKLAAKSLLNADYISELEKKEDGPQQIEWLKKQAGQEIPTAETWVNLSHALSISPPAKEPMPLKVRVNATYNPPKKN